MYRTTPTGVLYFGIGNKDEIEKFLNLITKLR